MTTISKQTKIYGPKTFTENGQKYLIKAEFRHDDSCNNGHNSFAITGEIDRLSGTRWIDDIGGCIHDEIVRHFPELAGFIKWHICSTDGPMHYVANTMYHASERDHWGTLKGEVRAWETSIVFDNNPIRHTPGRGFVKWLKESGPGHGRPYDFEILRCDHEKTKGLYNFSPKYTFRGFADKWYECPFDTELEAMNFLEAMQLCAPQFVETPTSWGEGKEPNLEYARQSAIWFDASLEQLSDKRALEARLPALLTEFQKAVESLGLTY